MGSRNSDNPALDTYVDELKKASTQWDGEAILGERTSCLTRIRHGRAS
jgi:hypothetical protein